jgi:hypothetical protein
MNTTPSAHPPSTRQEAAVVREYGPLPVESEVAPFV